MKFSYGMLGCFLISTANAHSITRPSLGDGIPIASNSDLEGVCKSFGYERYLAAAATDLYYGPLIVINENGKVAEGGVSLNRNKRRNVLSRIECENKISNQTQATKKLNYKDLKFRDEKGRATQKSFSVESDQNGICINQAYDFAAVGSAFATGLRSPEAVTVDENGKALSAHYSHNAIDSVVCIYNLE